MLKVALKCEGSRIFFTPELQEAKLAELPSVNLTEIEKMKVIAINRQGGRQIV